MRRLFWKTLHFLIPKWPCFFFRWKKAAGLNFIRCMNRSEIHWLREILNNAHAAGAPRTFNAALKRLGEICNNFFELWPLWQMAPINSELYYEILQKLLWKAKTHEELTLIEQKTFSSRARQMLFFEIQRRAHIA